MIKANKQLKVGALALMASLYSTGIVAETANGVAITTVITPLIINNLVTMNFTTIASGTNGGDLTMDDAGAIVTSGDADVIGAGGTALSFDISGAASQAYTLTVGDENRAPVLDLITDKNMNEGDTLDVTVDYIAWDNPIAGRRPPLCANLPFLPGFRQRRHPSSVSTPLPLRRA